MVRLQFYPVDFAYETTQNGKAIIQIFGRTYDGKKVCGLVSGFNHYFYVILKVNIEDAEDRISEINLSDRDQLYYVLETHLETVRYYGRSCKGIKVIVNHPRSIKPIKKVLDSLFPGILFAESDISFVKRYILDHNIVPLQLTEVDAELIERKDLNVEFAFNMNSIVSVDPDLIENPKILAFDIEAYTEERRYPNREKDPIVMIAFSGSDGFKKVITWKSFNHINEYIEFVDDEQGLLRKFVTIVNEINPDYLVGYFSDGFDLPYIKSRAQVLGIKIKFNSSSLKISRPGSNTTAKIKGIAHLDIFKFIKSIMSGSLRLENYSLGTVSMELINMKKLDTDIGEIGTIWDNNPELLERFCEYNLNDADLTLNLCNKILPNLNELVKLVNMPISDVCRMGYSQLVDSYLVKRSKEFNELFPDKPNFGSVAARRLRTYKGAFVFNPIPKLYQNVVVFDFQSLYPSIIVTHNISPLTLVKEDGHVSPEIELDNGKTITYCFAKQEGFIPSVIRDIIIRRRRVKDLLKDDKYNPILEGRSYALKTVMNATYGYFGFFGARWYSMESAEAITAFGRKYIQDVIREAQAFGFGVIYSDTDSIFLELGNKTKDYSKNFLESVNRRLPGFMELELENYYSRAIFVMKKSEAVGAKKKYALISEDGRIKVRGFETIRRDWSPIARDVQKEVLSLVLRENSPEKAFEYVIDVLDKVRNKKLPKEKMIIQTQLKKNVDNYDLVSPHVTVAKYMKMQGLHVAPGSIISYIIVPGKGKINERAVLSGEANDYDSEYYVNNQIIPAVERIFDALGYNVFEILKGKEQSNLRSFLEK